MANSEKQQQQQQQTYLPGYEPSHVLHHEWRTLENSAAYLLPTLRKIVAEKPDAKILDVGAGSGTITVDFAASAPQGQVTAVDLSEDILARAQRFAESAGVTNITFQQGDVYKLPFADGTFDITHAHQMLMHLKNPVDAIRELCRVTRAEGGVVAIRDADMASFKCWPESPRTRKFWDILYQTHEAAGGSNAAGRELLSWALEAGVPREKIQLSFGTWSWSTTEQRQLWSVPMAGRLREGGMRKKAIELGIATEAELDDWAVAWEEWADIPAAVYASMHGEILIHI